MVSYTYDCYSFNFLKYWTNGELLAHIWMCIYQVFVDFCSFVLYILKNQSPKRMSCTVRVYARCKTFLISNNLKVPTMLLKNRNGSWRLASNIESTKNTFYNSLNLIKAMIYIFLKFFHFFYVILSMSSYIFNPPWKIPSNIRTHSIGHKILQEFHKNDRIMVWCYFAEWMMIQKFSNSPYRKYNKQMFHFFNTK